MMFRPALVASCVAMMAFTGCAVVQHPVATDSSLANSSRTESDAHAVTALAGTWTGGGWRINARGPNRIEDTLVLTVDENGLVSGTRNWKTLEGAGGHAGLTPVRADEEQLLGVFNWQTGEFRLVETNEPGTIEGQLLDADTIEFFGMQPGRLPSTSRERLSRVPGK